MKVCILTSSFPRFEGDFPGSFVYELGRHLTDTGIQVLVLAPHDSGYSHREKMGDIEVYRFPYFIPRSLQRTCYRAGIADNLRRSWLARVQFPLFGLSEIVTLLYIRLRYRIDIVNSHWMLMQGLTAALLQKSLGLPHISTIHAADLFALQSVAGGNQVARFITKGSDHIFTVSSYIRSSLDSLIGEESGAEVLPMGVDISRFSSDLAAAPSQSLALLFAGRLVEKKGVKYLIQAMQIVARQQPGCNLLIAGDGPLRRDLEQQVKSLGLDEEVTFLGQISQTMMPSLYRKVNLVVVPSIVDSQGETEGLPVVLLESLAAGKPVVASDVSGIADVVENSVNGFLVPPEEPTELATKILLALDSFQDIETSRRIRESVSRYDWKNVANRYAQVFSENVGSN